MVKFSAQEWSKLAILKALCLEEAKYKTFLRFTDGMNIVGLDTMKRAVKAGIVAHYPVSDWIEWVHVG